MIHIFDPPLSQWDVGRVVKISETDATHILFANQGDSKGPIFDLKGNEATVPDYLLQTGKQLLIYLIKDGITLEGRIFPVDKKPRPSNYVYTETEVLTWEDLDRRLKALETGGGTSGSNLLVVTITGFIGDPLTSSHNAVEIYNHYKKYGNVIAYLEQPDEYISLNFSDRTYACFYVHQTRNGNVAILDINEDGKVSFSVIEHALKTDIPSVEDIIAELPVYKGEVVPV